MIVRTSSDEDYRFRIAFDQIRFDTSDGSCVLSMCDQPDGEYVVGAVFHSEQKASRFKQARKWTMSIAMKDANGNILVELRSCAERQYIGRPRLLSVSDPKHLVMLSPCDPTAQMSVHLESSCVYQLDVKYSGFNLEDAPDALVFLSGFRSKLSNM